VLPVCAVQGTVLYWPVDVFWARWNCVRGLGSTPETSRPAEIPYQNVSGHPEAVHIPVQRVGASHTLPGQ
jgi:hypothetical protein